MSGKPPQQNSISKEQITILLVDDIPEARENIKKLLAFEQDFKVIGAAGTGREGVEMAKDLQPDIIIMDINMPDMDGLEATGIIKKQVPTSAVIIMSVQNDADYMRRAMLAGARDFLSKPVNMDELYNTIRTVYRNTEDIRRQYEAFQNSTMDASRPRKSEGSGERGGNIIAVYSPKGGVGVTTIATNLASGLMKEGIKVLLVDADLQFGDVGMFLNLQAQSTIVELADDVDDLDVELFENIVTTHESGLKVLMGPARPEFADELLAAPTTVSQILSKVASNYDFIIVDTSNVLNEVLLNIFDVSTKILLVGTPTLPAVKSLRFVLDLFDQLGYDPAKTWLMLNKVWDERRDKGMLSAERIQNFLKRPVIHKIPAVDERVIISAINRGIPVIAAERDQTKPPTKNLLALADFIFAELMGNEDADETDEEQMEKRRSGMGGLLRRR